MTVKAKRQSKPTPKRPAPTSRESAKDALRAISEIDAKVFDVIRTELGKRVPEWTKKQVTLFESGAVGVKLPGLFWANVLRDNAVELTFNMPAASPRPHRPA